MWWIPAQTNLFEEEEGNIFEKNIWYMKDHATAPEGTSVFRCFKLLPAKFVTRWKFVEPDDKFWHPWTKKYNTEHRGPKFIIGLHNFIIGFYNFSSCYAILVPGYKFRRCQFEIPAWSVIWDVITYFWKTHTLIWNSILNILLYKTRFYYGKHVCDNIQLLIIWD